MIAVVALVFLASGFILGWAPSHDLFDLVRSLRPVVLDGNLARIRALEHVCEIRDTTGELVVHPDCSYCQRREETRKEQEDIALFHATRGPRVRPPWETGEVWREEDAKALDAGVLTPTFGMTAAEAERRILKIYGSPQ